MIIKALGIDIAKNVFQLHGVDEKGKAILKVKLRRDEFAKRMANFPSCEIFMEACAGAHYWANLFKTYGHAVELISPQYVKPFVKRNKNDAADAEAILIAGTRPEMHFVRAKTEEEQAMQLLHRTRAGFVSRRTETANQIRAALYEFGKVVPIGLGRLRNELPEWLGSGYEQHLHPKLRMVLLDLQDELKWLDGQITAYSERLEKACREDERCLRLKEIPGVGTLTATAAVALLGNGQQFKNGRHCAAYLGLVPKQHSSGGKERLLGISKRGNVYLRSIMVQGAQAKLRMVRIKARRDGIDSLDYTSRWVYEICMRRGVNKAAIALANKNARTIWAMLSKGEIYRKAA